VKAETPRALKAYGKLTPHNAGNNLAYDKEFVRKAVQFVIDNLTGNDKQLVHGSIDVAVIRRLGGIDWVDFATLKWPHFDHYIWPHPNR
jgi:hypothetical protein